MHTRTQLHRHTPTRTHSCSLSLIHIVTHTLTHSLTHTQTHPSAQTEQIHTVTQTHFSSLSRAHSVTHTHAHRHTQTHTHTLTPQSRAAASSEPTCSLVAGCQGGAIALGVRLLRHTPSPPLRRAQTRLGLPWLEHTGVKAGIPTSKASPPVPGSPGPGLIFKVSYTVLSVRVFERHINCNSKGHLLLSLDALGYFGRRCLESRCLAVTTQTLRSYTGTRCRTTAVCRCTLLQEWYTFMAAVWTLRMYWWTCRIALSVHIQYFAIRGEAASNRRQAHWSCLRRSYAGLQAHCIHWLSIGLPLDLPA